MKLVFKYGTMALAACLCLATCTKDFLDVEPAPPVVRADLFYQTEDQLFEGLVAAYDPLQWEFFDGNWVSMVMLGEIRSDNANTGGSSDDDQIGWQQIDDFTNSQFTLETRRIWTRYQFGIYRANIVLEKSDNLELTENVKRFKAEAKFLRAYYHFQLFKIYGPVPVINKVLGTDEKDYSLTRDTMSVVFRQIERDLTEAEPHLPLRSDMPLSENGRITRGAAHSLLARAYVYWADLLDDNIELFDKAAFYADLVYTSQEYRLIEYDTLFCLDCGNSPESIWEIQHSNLSPYYELNYNQGEEYDGNFMIQLCGIRGLCDDHTLYEPGWGFMLPTAHLEAFYLPDDTLRKKATLITLREIREQGGDCESFDPKVYANESDFESLWQKKYANYKRFDIPVGVRDVNKYTNVVDIRYADVLLLYAEALIRGSSGNTNLAKELINRVRHRASGFKDDYKTVDDLLREYPVRFNDIRKVIAYERRAEFAMEGDRWFDLVRSGRATPEYFSEIDINKSGDFDDFNDQWLPISEHEFNATGGNLTIYPSKELMR